MKSIFTSIAVFLLVSITLTAFKNVTLTNIEQKPPVAKAGKNKTINLPANSFNLNGSGKTTNGSITGYLWTLVSGPNVPVMNSPGSTTTSVSNFIAGKYCFQFMVTDKAGLIGIDKVNIVVIPSPVHTLTLQPAGNNNEVHLGFWKGDYSNHNPVEITAGSWTSGGSLLMTRGIFKFDLSSIPAHSTILSAKLTLYSNPVPNNGNLTDANSGPANAMYIERNLTAWDASSVTWQAQPVTDPITAVLIPATSLPFLDLVDIDVKNLVAPMVSTANFGFKIRLQNEVRYNIRQFCASRWADATKRPKLVITYQ